MNYHTIKDCDLLNGIGLRVVLFVSGCSHHCNQCHNPETWDKNSGILFDKDAMNELISCLDNDYINGLTLSGGDPMFPGNRKEVLDIIKTVKSELPDKTIWMYSGYTYEYLKSLDDETKEILNSIDVLVDGPFVLKLKDDNAHYRGSSNQRLINVPESLRSNSVILFNDI